MLAGPPSALFEIAPKSETQQLPVGRRDEQAGQVALADPPKQRVSPHARPDGARPFRHRARDSLVGVAGDRLAPEAAEDDALPDIGQLIVERARWHVSARDLGREWSRHLRTLMRKAVRTPGLLAGDEVVDLREPHALEPPRGSRAEVSLKVVAVDDHRTPVIELGRGSSIELLEGDVDRSLEMLLFVFVGRQNLDERTS